MFASFGFGITFSILKSFDNLSNNFGNKRPVMPLPVSATILSGLIFLMSIKDKTYGKGRKIEKNTFIGSMKGEEDIPHHYFTDKEIKTLFSKFKRIKITPTRYFNKIEAYDVEVIK